MKTYFFYKFVLTPFIFRCHSSCNFQMLIKFTRRKRCQMSQHAYLWPSTLSPFDVIGSNIYI